MRDQISIQQANNTIKGSSVVIVDQGFKIRGDRIVDCHLYRINKVYTSDGIVVELPRSTLCYQGLEFCLVVYLGLVVIGISYRYWKYWGNLIGQIQAFQITRLLVKKYLAVYITVVRKIYTEAVGIIYHIIVTAIVRSYSLNQANQISVV